MLLLVMLVFGTVIGALARLILPGRQNLSLSATTVAGLLGAATVGSVTAAIVGHPLLDIEGPSLLGSLAGAVGFVAIADAIVTRRRLEQAGAARTPTRELLGRGESARVEFKSAARYNVHTRERDPRIEHAIARTVAGFANAEGGTLLIGVDDDAQPVGLDHDLKLVKGGDLDRYELWLHDLLGACLGRPALRHVRVDFDDVDGTTVCRVDVAPADAAVFLHPQLGDTRPQFQLRIGNSTRELAVDEAIEYVVAHFRPDPVTRAGTSLRSRLRRGGRSGGAVGGGRSAEDGSGGPSPRPGAATPPR